MINTLTVLLMICLVFTLGFTDEELDTGCEGLPDTTDFLSCMNQDVIALEEAEYLIDSIDGGDSLDDLDMGED